ncbi:MAG: nucleoside-diphosphate kinase [Verrucomicrobia bacterium]|nr:nucleoside-diphosphate kinase [Verrucomicrobiota bacterium]
MAEELSYVLVTPYSIRKSRTGGIISRLISRTGLDLIRARMFAPSKELVETYASTLVTDADPRHHATQELIRDYVLKNFLPNTADAKPRVLLLVFCGENAVAKLRSAVGSIAPGRPSGENIRDTYGDYITDAAGNVVYFEPAVLCPPDAVAAERNLKLWARYSDTDGGVLEGISAHPEQVERTLVLIKPDNFRFPNARPGGVIDVFSRAGLTIVGAKVHFMSVAQACEFYGPVLDVLKNIFRDRTAPIARLAIEQELGIQLNDAVQKQLGEILGPINGQQNWESIVQFMSGCKPSECPPERREEPGTEKCFALVYEGVDAVRKIREVLGPTDPSKAPPGSIRREFGQTIMVNAAHASDSAENARREFKIVKIDENNLKPFVESFYGSL